MCFAGCFVCIGEEWQRLCEECFETGDTGARCYKSKGRTGDGHAFIAERSAGDIHDFYSEGDYWWPDTLNLDGPYIRRDGQTNPDNFVSHRHAMIRFSSIVGNLTSAYLLNQDKKYVDAVLAHVRAWFVNESTRMNPNLQYAQAIKGITTGRGIGIIDTIHLMEVAQSLYQLEKLGVLPEDDVRATKRWFADYSKWMFTHQYGIDEMNAKNNHGTCWVMQTAVLHVMSVIRI